jgi:hypothetical protein
MDSAEVATLIGLFTIFGLVWYKSVNSAMDSAVNYVRGLQRLEKLSLPLSIGTGQALRAHPARGVATGNRTRSPCFIIRTMM